jgi:hypothetical protein
MAEIHNTLLTMRNMVDSFVCRHFDQWEKVRKEYEDKYGFSLGSPLSLQSYIGSDLTIDLVYLAKDLEERMAFKNEYWIRSQGMQCIRTKEDRDANERVWSDVLAKFTIEKKADGSVEFQWIEDDKCRVKNTLLKDNVLYDRYF